MRKPKPGASEVYTILVPCALTAGGKHDVKLKLRSADNRVTFEGVCNRRVAEAHDALAGCTAVSCLLWVDGLRDAIRDRHVTRIDLAHCRTCAATVRLFNNDCPFQVFGQDYERTHHIDRRDLPFWERIVRSGRVR